MRLIYNILFTIFFWLSSPYYFMRMRRRGNWQEGFSERFGKFSSKVKQAMTNRHVLWMHAAVSVGEVNIATWLIAALENRMPNLKIVVLHHHHHRHGGVAEETAVAHPEDLLPR